MLARVTSDGTEKVQDNIEPPALADAEFILFCDWLPP
jgi:hypothetical protein